MFVGCADDPRALGVISEKESLRWMSQTLGGGSSRGLWFIEPAGDAWVSLFVLWRSVSLFLGRCWHTWGA